VQLIYVCSPANPCGKVMTLDEWRTLFELADRHGFVIASDECYSEIYFDEARAAAGRPGSAAHALGRSGFERLIVFSSLSKRSNVPGLRSGFVAGDARLIKRFLLYRTYHGSAMGQAVQMASIAAWNDEAHVRDNRALYRAKFAAVQPLIASVMPAPLPDASFYLWARTPIDDAEFARRLLAEYNVAVLPGSYLAREAAGINPGCGLHTHRTGCAGRRMPAGRQAHRGVLPFALKRTVSRRSSSSAFQHFSFQQFLRDFRHAGCTADHRNRLRKPYPVLARQCACRHPRSGRIRAFATRQRRLRVAERIDGDWVTHQWIKKAVLLSFRLQDNVVMDGGETRYYDKVPMKFAGFDEAAFRAGGFRVVPPASVRRGAFISKNVVLMPSYVNIGAYVGEGTMVDTWATVGSCAQIGRNVHLSGGVGIGGVLEPVQANPTIIGDNCFVGARSEVVEGVIVEDNCVISMGVYIGQSTKIYDRATGEVMYGRVPEGSVVVSGNLPSADGKYSLYCAVIVKRVDAQTRAKTSINELLRA
jgi:2,3,4,5-tetrahydropyridine-2-carboxylate N-succinyltransferase